MPWFGQEIFEQAEAKGPLTEEAYTKALETNLRLSRGEGLDAALSAQKLDALISPTMGPAYLTDWLNGDHYGGSGTSPCAVAGYPHVTVPAGHVHGLPWGLSFMGTAWSEAKLIRLRPRLRTGEPGPQGAALSAHGRFQRLRAQVEPAIRGRPVRGGWRRARLLPDRGRFPRGRATG